MWCTTLSSSKGNCYILFACMFLFQMVFAQSQDINKATDSILRLVANEKNRDKKIDLYYTLSLMIEHHDIDKSKHYSHQIYVLSSKMKSDRGLGLYHNTQASINFKIKNLQKAKHHANKAEVIFLRLFDTSFYLKNVRTKARILSELNEVKEEYECLIKAHNISLETNEHNEIADIAYLLAQDYTFVDVSTSFYYLNLAIKHFKLSKDTVGIAGCYYLLATIYLDTDQYKKALEFNNKAYELVKDMHNKIFLLFCYRQLSDINIALARFDAAIAAAKSGIDVNIKYGSSYDISYEYNSLANIYLKKNDFELSKKYLRMALNASPTESTKFLIYKSYGLLYYQMGAYSESEQFFKDGINLLGDDNLQTERDIFNDYAKLLTALGKHEEAYSNLKKYTELQSTFLIDEKEKRLNALQIQFEVENKEYELQNALLLKEKNEQKFQFAKRNNAILTALFLILVVAILVISFFLVLNRKKNLILKSKNDIIQSKVLELELINKKVSNLLNVKETLLKEVHHRVKNNLQLIISLLKIQAKGNPNPEIQDFVEKGQSRIQTMAIIHENLYKSDDLSEIVLKDYIAELFFNVKNAFQKPHQNISLDLDVPEISFSVQTAIPLGLIMNELLCNSFKHAFPMLHEGTITIAFRQSEDSQFGIIAVQDNGVGCKQEEKSSTSVSMGLQLSHLLAKQLGGRIEKFHDNGTKFHIYFKLPQ